MREELLHALLVSSSFEVHIGLITVDFSILVRAAEEHSQVANSHSVAPAHVDLNARVLLLMQSDLTSILFWLQNDVWLLNDQLFLIEV